MVISVWSLGPQLKAPGAWWEHQFVNTPVNPIGREVGERYLHLKNESLCPPLKYLKGHEHLLSAGLCHVL